VFVTSFRGKCDKSGHPEAWKPETYHKKEKFVESQKPKKDKEPKAMTKISQNSFQDINDAERFVMVANNQVNYSWSSQSLQQVAVRTKIIGETFGVANKAFGSVVRSNTWVSMIPELSQPTKALEIAALALCTSRLSQSTSEKNVVLAQSSRKLYVQGIQAVQGALLNPKLMYKDETLAACMLLAMFEVFECPAGSRGGYFSHCNGVGTLIRLRGPEAHQDGLAFAMFGAYRSMAVCTCKLTIDTD
jgi:hypothetical protein